MKLYLKRDLTLISSLDSSLDTERLLDQVHVNVSAQRHTILEGPLIVRFRTLGLNVLLDSKDLRLILDKFLLNVIQAVVDLILHDLVLLGIMLHSMVSHLLLQSWLVLLYHHLDRSQSNLLLFE